MADDAGRLNQVFAETSFLYGSNAAYIEELHEKWANDPGSVSAEWKAFFDQLRDNADSVKASASAGAWGRSTATEPSEQTAVFDGRWPTPKPDAKKPGASAQAEKAAPVTAVFAGLLTKVGVYAMIRTETLLFPGEHVNALLLVVAALTMVVGILGALAQTDIKRILSFILVSHIGYMIFGLGLATEAGLAATVYYVAHHITVQTALFLVTGLIENRAGTANIDRLGSLAKVSPFVSVLFLVPALNLGGIPPFSGFLGKVGLLRGGVEQATPLAYTLVGVSLLVSLLTLLVVVRVWTRAFWRRVEDVEHPPAQLVAAYERAVARGERPRPLEPGLVLPTTALVGLTLVFTVAAGPLFALADEAATDMLDRSPYIAAVLDDAAAERAAATLSVDPTEVHDARK